MDWLILALAAMRSLLAPLPDMPPDLVTPYLEARASWGPFVCPDVLVVKWADDLDIMAVTNRPAAGAYQTRFWFERRIGTIFIWKGLFGDREAQVSTLAHEIGHAAGLPDKGSGLMSDNWTRPLPLGPSDEEKTEGEKSCK